MDILAVSEQIKILCVKLNISVSELARLCGTSPQAFIQKMKRETFTPAELKKVAEAAGCKFESSFVLPDGDRVTDWFLKGYFMDKIVNNTEFVIDIPDYEGIGVYAIINNRSQKMYIGSSQNVKKE